MANKKEYIDREAVLTVLKTVFAETDPVGDLVHTLAED